MTDAQQKTLLVFNMFNELSNGELGELLNTAGVRPLSQFFPTLLLLLMFVSIGTTIGQLINPEYYALQEVMELVK